MPAVFQFYNTDVDVQAHVVWDGKTAAIYIDGYEPRKYRSWQKAFSVLIARNYHFLKLIEK